MGKEQSFCSVVLILFLISFSLGSCKNIRFESGDDCRSALRRGELFREVATAKGNNWKDLEAAQSAFSRAVSLCPSENSSSTKQLNLLATSAEKSATFRRDYYRAHLRSVVPLVNWYVGEGYAEKEDLSSPFGVSIWSFGEDGCENVAAERAVRQLDAYISSQEGNCGVIVDRKSFYFHETEEFLSSFLESHIGGCRILLDEFLSDLPSSVYLDLLALADELRTTPSADLGDDSCEFLGTTMGAPEEQMNSKRNTADIYQSLARMLSLDQLLVIHVDVGRILEGTFLGEAIVTLVTEDEVIHEATSSHAFCQDRSKVFPLGLAIGGAVFLSTLWLPKLLQKTKFYSPPSAEADKLSLRSYAMPVTALTALVCPWLLRSDFVGLIDLAPSETAHIGRSWWWVLFYCSLLLVTPILMILLVFVRFNRVAEALREPWMQELMGMGSALGSGLHLLWGSTLYCGVGAVRALPVFPVLCASGFFLGKLSSDFVSGIESIGIWLMFEFLACVFGLVAISAIHSSMYLYQLSIFIALVLTIYPISHRYYTLWKTRKEDNRSVLQVGAELSGLSLFDENKVDRKSILPQALKNHDGLPFVGVGSHEAALHLVKTYESPHPEFIFLLGPRAAGKSRVTREALIGEGKFLEDQGVFSFHGTISKSSEHPMKSSLHKKPQFQVHVGSAEGGGRGDEETKCPPLQPLMKALGKLVGHRRFSGADSQFSGLLLADEATGLSSILPLISGGGGVSVESDGGKGPDLNVLADAIFRTLKIHSNRLFKMGIRICIVLEDMESSDTSTQETLILLMRRIARDPLAVLPITFVMSVRDDLTSSSESETPEWVETMVDTLPTERVSLHKLRHWTCAEVRQLLQRLSFHSTFIHQNVEDIHAQTGGNPLWIFNVLSEIWSRNHLIWISLELTGDGWTFADDIHGFESLPMPKEMYQLLQERIKSLSEKDLRLLSVAALLGTEFNALLLSETIGEPPLTVMMSLTRLEKDTQIIVEVSDEEDYFRFSSGGYTEALLSYFTNDKGAFRDGHSGIPQIHRHIHKQVTEVLEKWITTADTTHHPTRHIFGLARHSSFAGTTKIKTAFLSNLMAALESARSMSNHEMTHYSLVALSCGSSFGRRGLVELARERYPLEAACRHFLPSYISFVERESKLDWKKWSGRISRRHAGQKEGDKYEEAERISDAWIGKLCQIRGSALLKKNPLAHWKDALDVFERYNAPDSPDCLIVRSVALTLGGRYVQGEYLALQALRDESLVDNNIAFANTQWAIAMCRYRQQKEEEARKVIFSGLYKLSLVIPHLSRNLSALQKSFESKEEKEEEGETTSGGELESAVFDDAPRDGLEVASKLLNILGVCLMQTELERAIYSLRLGFLYAENLGDSFGIGMLSGQLGKALALRAQKSMNLGDGENCEKDLKEAMELFKKSKKVSHQMGNTSGEVLAGVGLGETYLLLRKEGKGGVDKAIREFVSAKEIGAVQRRRGHEGEGLRLQMRPLISLVTLYFRGEENQGKKKISFSKAEIVETAERLGLALVECLDPYLKKSPLEEGEEPPKDVEPDFMLLQNLSALFRLRVLVESGMGKWEEGDHRFIWAQKLIDSLRELELSIGVQKREI